MKAPHKWDVRYQVEIGTEERHVLDVSWDQVWGLMSVRVDGNEVVHRRHLFGFRRLRRYELSVGEHEVHKVVVEKRKTLLVCWCAHTRPSTSSSTVRSSTRRITCIRAGSDPDETIRPRRTVLTVRWGRCRADGRITPRRGRRPSDP